jgi:hypothetical protein
VEDYIPCDSGTNKVLEFFQLTADNAIIKERVDYGIDGQDYHGEYSVPGSCIQYL